MSVCDVAAPSGGPRLEASCPKCGSRSLRRVKGSRYACLSCGYEFYACPYCGEAFAQKWQLASHIRSHRKPGERELLEELKALRAQLERVLAALEEVQAGQRLILSRLDQALRAVERRPERPAQAPEDLPELPEFARGNPWLGILARRGGEGA
jgi:predicted RNA-binding Zn-ribbon protein involved in translation (DUF1610 family)